MKLILCLFCLLNSCTWLQMEANEKLNNLPFHPAYYKGIWYEVPNR